MDDEEIPQEEPEHREEDNSEFAENDNEQTEPDEIDRIDENFFDTLGIGDSRDLFRKWQMFLEEHPRAKRRRRYRYLLELIGGIGEAHVRNYLHSEPLRFTKVSDDVRNTLDLVTKALGEKLPHGSIQPRRAPETSRRPRRVALFTEFRVPSERFHFYMLSILTRQAAARGIALSIHEVDNNLSETLDTATRLFRPNGVLLLRLTPTRKAVDILEKRSLPTVLIHADRLDYPTPIVTNITPCHDKMQKELAEWLTTRSQQFDETAKVGVVTLPNERAKGEFPITGPFGGSIRNERHHVIRQALKHLNAKFLVVDDFSFYRAEEVLYKLPNCGLYIGLSDVIAVATKQLASHTCEVIGFDNTEIAQRASISSFDQQLEEVASLAIKHLCAQFVGDDDQSLPDSVDVTLAIR